MAYNEIFSVSSAISLLQKPDSLQVHYTWTAPLDASGSISKDKLQKANPRYRLQLPSTEAQSQEVMSRHASLTPVTDEPVDQSSVTSESNRESAESTIGDHRPPSSTHRVLSICYCRRDLLAVKVFYFSFIGALGVIFPYMGVFLKQIGLSAFQIGVISGVRPVIGFISAPLWGSLADRFNRRRSMMIVSMIAWLGFFVWFYFLNAPGRLKTPFPEEPSLHRSHIRFRRNQQSDVYNQTLANSNRTSLESCNYSFLGSEEKELLKENLSWIYDPVEGFWTFIICIVIICGGELFQAPTTALSDAATLRILGRQDLHQYGAQRAWGPIGWAISSLVVGSLLSANRWPETVCGIDLVFSDYRIIAYFFIGIMVIGILAGFNIKFGESSKNGSEEEGTNPERCDGSSKSGNASHSTLAVFKFFLNVHYGSWIVTAFFVGFLNGIIWGFLFWHLDNLGGTQLLMGVDSVVMCVFEFAAFFFVDHATRLVGHIGIMYVGLVCYSIRFLIYASIVNPWFVLPADALQGLTFSFIWVSLTAYTAESIPSVSLATVQGIIHGVYFGLGNGLGHLIGGILIGTFGAVVTFYSFAGATAVWLVIFFICQKVGKKPSVGQFSYQDLTETTVDTNGRTGN